jgi:hypothetical protein
MGKLHGLCEKLRLTEHLFDLVILEGLESFYFGSSKTMNSFVDGGLRSNTIAVSLIPCPSSLCSTSNLFYSSLDHQQLHKTESLQSCHETLQPPSRSEEHGLSSGLLSKDERKNFSYGSQLLLLVFSKSFSREKYAGNALSKLLLSC